jgi:hypothetical protein
LFAELTGEITHFGDTCAGSDFSNRHVWVLQHEVFGFVDSEFANPVSECLFSGCVDVRREVLPVGMELLRQQFDGNAFFGKSLGGKPFGNPVLNGGKSVRRYGGFGCGFG